jgi:hypothetical protein
MGRTSADKKLLAATAFLSGEAASSLPRPLRQHVRRGSKWIGVGSGRCGPASRLRFTFAYEPSVTVFEAFPRLPAASIARTVYDAVVCAATVPDHVVAAVAATSVEPR